MASQVKAGRRRRIEATALPAIQSCAAATPTANTSVNRCAQQTTDTGRSCAQRSPSRCSLSASQPHVVARGEPLASSPTRYACAMDERHQGRSSRPGANWFDEEPAGEARARRPQNGASPSKHAPPSKDEPGIKQPPRGLGSRGLIKRILFLAVALVGLYFVWPQLV